MSDTVIKVENLSKSYTISHQSGERYTALRDVLTNGAKTLGSRLLSRNHAGALWARSTEPDTLTDQGAQPHQGQPQV